MGRPQAKLVADHEVAAARRVAAEHKPLERVQTARTRPSDAD